MKNNFKIIALIGAPCSGKGTLAKKLSEELKYEHISTGDIFRKNIIEKTEIGKKAQYYVENGLLCPDELGFEIILDFMKNNTKNIILDGFPRSVNDYNFLKENNIIVDKYYILNVKEEELINRSKERWIHASSGRTYNLTFNPPKKEGIDDITGEKLIQRKEDTPEIFKNRLTVFNEKTQPLINLLKEEKINNVIELNNGINKKFFKKKKCLKKDISFER